MPSVSRTVRHRAERRAAGAGDGGISASVVKLLADLGAVLAVITAIFYYFGWVRTRFQARELGFDVAALNLSTADYLLKSLNVLFAPLLVLVTVALLLHHVHRRHLIRLVRTSTETRALRAARLLGLAWVPLIVVASLLFGTSLRGYGLPVGLLLAVLLAGYGRWLRMCRTGRDPWTPVTKTLLLVLLLLATFWSTERFARTMGEAFGADLADDPGQLPAVVIFSGKDLELGGPGVTTEPRTTPDGAYKFRYSGLRLLERSGDRYFLITDHPGRVIILSESDEVRMEFVRPENGPKP